MSKLALLLVVLAGCEADVPERTSSGEPTQMREWRAQLMSREAAIVGSVTLRTDLDAEAFTATIDVRGEVPGEVRSWHVHLGTCASGGPIIGTQAAYPAFTIGADGTASASSIVFAPLDLDVTYHATVHDAANELIACGNFSEPFASP